MTEEIFRYNFKPEDFSPEAIAESGQCFRMVPEEGGCYRLIAMGRALLLKEEPDGSISVNTDRQEFDRIWRGYFDLDQDYGEFRRLIRDDDEFLKTAASFGTGIRILRQEPFEMLISFIISQRKSIPAIRTAIERLSQSFGEEHAYIDALGQEQTYYSFPKPEAVLRGSEQELAACGLGYRLPYVREACERVLEGGLEGLSELPAGELIERLISFKGVGIKVASCVALFGYHRLEIAPVDVWMKRVIDQVYGGSLPEGYSPYAGVIQQYLFNYARITKLGSLT